MSGPADWRTRAERIKATGLADSKTIADAKPGAVYSVVDESIHFPEEELIDSGRRNMHDYRRVIVVQASILCASRAPKTLLVIPCSTRFNIVPTYEWQVPEDQIAFTKRALAFVSLVQPILKNKLGTHHGHLTSGALLELQARMAQALGLLGQNTIVASGPSHVVASHPDAVMVEVVPLAAASAESDET